MKSKENWHKKEEREEAVEENLLQLLFADEVLTQVHFSYYQYESDQFISDMITQLKDKQLTTMTFLQAMQQKYGLKLGEQDFEPVYNKLLKSYKGFEDLKGILGRVKNGEINMGVQVQEMIGRI